LIAFIKPAIGWTDARPVTNRNFRSSDFDSRQLSIVSFFRPSDPNVERRFVRCRFNFDQVSGGEYPLNV